MEKVVQAHGANIGASCAKCKSAKNREEWEIAIEKQQIMRCKDMVADPEDDQKKVVCNGPVKSNITFFGERMPKRFHWGWDVINNTQWGNTDPIDEAYGCDLMIVMGTGLAVWPFQATVVQPKKECPKVLINLNNTATEGYDFDDLYNFPERLFL